MGPSAAAWFATADTIVRFLPESKPCGCTLQIPKLNLGIQIVFAVRTSQQNQGAEESAVVVVDI